MFRSAFNWFFFTSLFLSSFSFAFCCSSLVGLESLNCPNLCLILALIAEKVTLSKSSTEVGLLAAIAIVALKALGIAEL